ncbi:4-(cytidine 5'-diphospho)-2-C-methyl-D-erythritol kinase [Mariluticola halotolerans]|uniref:4-(cytidine 5'-diphospho)-2-C-methyl-D-erythritol kinase n=1 Tax=Mariluticola halotolerans TaxID=2909283 RepID=UPI0026E40F86|nr:4-(cytidine 5'-diphospho)-2-C-methyl-D-erythritol kinase [Mariluticola halotolerans]UJQ95821.1 4-(cytidine 5'-diphospho)-2-C-methyl-D-erythritol kinase [Mariluticola halotolerans]
MRDSFFETAPAKINLALHVTGRRADGYHDLESLVVFAGVADELQARAVSGDDSLTLNGPFAEALTTGQSNLVFKAITAFRARWPDAISHGIAIELTKNLPVAAGIGGGSADAAAALRLLASLSVHEIDPAALSAIAASLGADVPVCLLSSACIAAGVGEVVRPLPRFPACHVVLVNPLVPIATADIFRRLRQRNNAALPAFDAPPEHISLLALWLEQTRNDLEEAAIETAPVIGEIIGKLGSTRGCVAARMSGSGATVFGLYGSSAEAHQAAHDIREIWPDFWVAAAPVQ